MLKLLAGAVIGLAGFCVASAQDAPFPSPIPLLTEEEAREEVAAVHGHILAHHPDPYWFHAEAVWTAQVSALQARSGPVDLVDQYFGLSALMALAMDTHVQAYPENDTPGFERAYPIRFRRYEEGVIVAAADDPYRDWVGARVLAVASAPIDQVVEQTAQFGFSDHPDRRRTFGVEYILRMPALYRHMGWMDDALGVPLLLETPDGRRIETRLYETEAVEGATVNASGHDAGHYWPEGWRTLADLGGAPIPLSRRHLDLNYWHAELEGGRVLYVQINTPSDQEGRPGLAQWTVDLFHEVMARETPPERTIIDVRHNLGGWVEIQLPLAFILSASDLCCRPGNVVILTSRETISAGSVLVGFAERATRPVVIGEPTGGKPNIFLQAARMDLPHSPFGQVEASQARLDSTDSTDRRMFAAPDILVPERAADVIAGRDAALERALALTAEEARTFYPSLQAAFYPWLRPSQAGAQGPQ
jgi:hypothetical protein